MASGLPLKEIKVLLNKPGEELDERLTKANKLGAKAKGGYLVELEGNLEKDAQGELQFVGKVTTDIAPMIGAGILESPVEASGSAGKKWSRSGDSDVKLQFWFSAEVG